MLTPSAQSVYAGVEYGAITVSPLSDSSNAKFNNTAYKNYFGVSAEDIVSVTANGSEYSDGSNTYSVANAFDGNNKTYWYSQAENSDDFKNALTISFKQPVNLSNILYKSAYFSSGGRQFAGYPSILNVYVSNGNTDFALAGTCESEAVQGQSEEVIFSLASSVVCDRVKLEFAEVTTINNGFAWLKNKKIAAAMDISFFCDEGAPISNTVAATGSFADTSYLQLNSIPSDELKYRANGGELTIANGTTYTLANAFDKKTNTFWCSESANTDEFTNKVTIILDTAQTLDSIVLGCAWSTQGNRNFYGFPEILKVYTSETDETPTLNSVFYGTPNNSWSLALFALPKPTLCKRVVLEFSYVSTYSGWENGRAIAMISEAYLMRAEDNATEVFQEINDIFADYSQLTLKEGYDKDKIDELREKVKDSGNYFSVLKPILDRAEAIASGVLRKDIYREFSTDSDAMNNILQVGDLSSYARRTLKQSSFGTNRQVTGIGGTTGEKIVIYVDGEEGDPLPSVAFTQIYGAWNSWMRTYSLHLGKNEIVFPNFKAGGSYTRAIAAGGPIHIVNPYTKTQQSSNVKIYIEGGYLYPVFRDGDDEGTFKMILTDYYERLMDPNDTSITVDAFEAVTGNIMLSCQASLAYTSYVKNGTSPQLNIDKWKAYIKGLLAFGGVEFDPDKPYYNEMNEYLKVNARAVQPYAGMYAFAYSEHIGIIDSATFGAMVQKWTTGWAFAHEIGHMLDNLNMKIPEVTNNMWAIYDIYMQNGAFNDRINVTNVSNRLASDFSSYVGTYWDNGHSNCDFWWIIEGGHPGYWAKLQRLYCTETSGNALNITERLAYYSSLATGEDMSEYFERWGFHFSGNNKFTYASASDTYKQLIADAKSRGEITGNGKKYWYVNNDQYRYTKLHGGTITSDWASCYNSSQVVEVVDIMRATSSNTLILPAPNNVEAHLCYEIQSYFNNEWKVIGVTFSTSFTDSYAYGDGVTPKYRIVAYDRMFNTTGVSNEYSPEAGGQSEVCRIDGVKYNSLSEAVAAASAGDTIYLLKDFKDGGIVISKNLTILPDPEIFSEGQSVTITKNASGHLFRIGANVTFGSATDGNKVPTGARIVLDGNSFSQNGALVYVNACTVVMNNVTMQNNFSGSNGGGLYIEYSAAVYVNNCIVKNNTGNNGGGIFINGRSSMSVRGLQLINNTAAANGGGVYISQYTGTSLLHNRDKVNGAYPEVIISGNKAVNGGGIFANNSIELYSARITDNVATNGGGVYCDIDNTARNCALINSTLSNNAANSGSAVYMNRGKFTLNGGIVDGVIYKRLKDSSFPSVFAVQSSMPNFDNTSFILSELSDSGVVLINIVTGLGAGFDNTVFNSLNVSDAYARFESGIGVKAYPKKVAIKITYNGGTFETQINYGKFVLPQTFEGLDQNKYIVNYIIDSKSYNIGDSITVTKDFEAYATVKDYFVVTLKYGNYEEKIKVTQNYVYYLPMKTPDNEVVFGWDCSDGKFYAYAQGAQIVGNTEFIAVIKQLHTLTTVVEGAETSVKYDYGSAVTLASPPAILGKSFSHWEIDGKKYTANQTVSVTSDIRAVAVYTDIWRVTTVIDDIEVEEYYKTGHELTLEGVGRLLGREFKYWLVNNVKYYAGSTYTVNSETEIIAVFTQINTEIKLTLTLISNKGSSGEDDEIVENEERQLEYQFGSIHNFTAPEVNEGNVFLYWEVNGVQYTAGTTLMITENITANAVVAKVSDSSSVEQFIDVTLKDYVDGTIQSVVYKYKESDKILLAQAVNPYGKKFLYWLVNGEMKAAGESFVLVAGTPVEVVAVYDVMYSTVVVSQFTGGAITSVSKNLYIGDKFILPDIASAPVGKKFSHWEVNGVEYDAGAELTVTEDLSIVAVYVDDSAGLLPSDNVDEDKGNHTGLIVGLVVGIVAAIGISVGGVIFIKRRKAK
ncbi:MAG: discoidin domain-containing protein [Clostridia bacterium]|nr:discoidin domain-containing protein [Clostridia bacterium]